jgi:hypothetical protein
MTELKLSKKSGKPSFPQTLGGNAQNQTAALLNAMASGGGQNEYIWIKWTK